MIQATLYTRVDCNLCDQTYHDLQELKTAIPHKLRVVDIDQRQELIDLYGVEIPVVEVGPYKLKAPISYQELEVARKTEEGLTVSHHGGCAFVPLIGEEGFRQ